MSKEQCPNCGSYLNQWDFCGKNLSGVVDGRLRLHETSTDFYLGCLECSETIRVMNPQQVVNQLNKRTT